MAPRLHYDDVTFDLQKPRRPQLSVMEDLCVFGCGCFPRVDVCGGVLHHAARHVRLSLGVTGVYIQILVRILEVSGAERRGSDRQRVSSGERLSVLFTPPFAQHVCSVMKCAATAATGQRSSQNNFRSGPRCESREDGRSSPACPSLCPTGSSSGRRLQRRSWSSCDALTLGGGEFALSDVFYFYKKGVESIVDDQGPSASPPRSSPPGTSSRAQTRTSATSAYASPSSGASASSITLAIIGLSWLVIGTTLVGFLPESRICARGLSATVHYHNKEQTSERGICVANHTTPIDVVILANDGCYAMGVGQVHGGLMGVIQKVDGEVVSSRVVREVGDERPTRR
ncbi:hypothetical protein INR49_010127 [Caranx melampygus]|nr:hypothetical protein INR49_010127 [Caranx melampygus]